MKTPAIIAHGTNGPFECPDCNARFDKLPDAIEHSVGHLRESGEAEELTGRKLIDTCIHGGNHRPQPITQVFEKLEGDKWILCVQAESTRQRVVSCWCPHCKEVEEIPS